MSTNASGTAEELCPQCYGKEWVRIKGRRVSCTCVARRAIGDVHRRTRR